MASVSSRLKLIVQLLRLQNASHPGLGILLGYFLSGADNLARCALVLAAFLLLHSLVTVWNDIEDEQIDIKNGRHTLGQLRKQGGVTLLRGVMIAMAVAAVGISLRLPVETNLWLLAFIVLAWLYNSAPLYGSRRPYMSMVIMWLTYGVIPFGLGLSLGSPVWLAIFAGLSWSLVRLSLSLLKDFKDARGDADSGKRTLLLVTGKTAVARLSIILTAAGYIGLIVTVYLITAWLAFLLLLVPAYWIITRRLELLAAQSYGRLDGIFHEGLRYQLYFDGILVTCLSIWARS